MNPVINETRVKMGKTLETLKSDVSKIRTGKASVGILDGIRVEYYGSNVPLSQVASVTVLDSHSLQVTPWDRTMAGVIDKAILTGDLGLNPVNDGVSVRIPIPPLNEERRRELVKLVKKFAEDAKIAMRNIRRDSNESLKKLEKQKEITEDQLKEYETDVQKATDEHIEKVEQILKKKEKEMMEV